MIYTIGHSTRSLDEFIEMLKHFKIELLVDVRRFPSSKKFPWFNKESLEKVLKESKISYVHFKALGGFRKEGYANFAKTEEFKKAVKKIAELANNKTLAIMCAEINPFKCHRRYIAQELLYQGNRVFHIITKDKIIEHSLLPEVQQRMKSKIKCDKS